MNNHYNDPLFIKWHTDSTGNKISLRMPSETQEIVKGKIFLNEIPDMLHRVKIDGFFEVNRVPQESNEFQVDYSTGMITFCPTLNELLGKNKNVVLTSKKGDNSLAVKIDEYYGRGVIMYPASRIYINLDENLEDFANTLQDIVSDSAQSQVKQLIEHFNENIEKSSTIYGNLTAENKIAKENIERLDNSKLGVDNSNEEASKRKKELDDTLSQINNTVTEAKSTNESLSTATDRAIQARQDINNLDLYIDKITEVSEEAKLANDKIAQLKDLDERAEFVLEEENLPKHIKDAYKTDEALIRDMGLANETSSKLGDKITLAQSTNKTLSETINKSIDSRAALDNSINSSKEQNTLGEECRNKLAEQLANANRTQETLPAIVDKAVTTEKTMKENEAKIDEKMEVLKENLKDADKLNEAANVIREGNFLIKGLHWGDFLKKKGE